jgi:hypothetical protein
MEILVLEGTDVKVHHSPVVENDWYSNTSFEHNLGPEGGVLGITAEALTSYLTTESAEKDYMIRDLRVAGGGKDIPTWSTMVFFY